MYQLASELYCWDWIFVRKATAAIRKPQQHTTFVTEYTLEMEVRAENAKTGPIDV